MRDFAKEIKEKHPNLIALEDIKKGDQKVRMRCEIDGYEWEYRPYDLLKGHGCHMCNGVPRYTTETFKKKVSSLNPKIKITSEYQSSHKKVDWFCLDCGNEGSTKAYQLLQGRGCRKCAALKTSERQRKTTQQFIDEVFCLVGVEYEVLGEYIHTDVNIKMKHNVCGEIFNPRPHNFLKGSRCPKCNGGVRKKNNEYHKEEVAELTKQEYDFVGFYKGSQTKSTYLHLSCGKTFETTPGSFLNQNTRCQECYSLSKGEIAVKSILEKKGVNFIQQKTFDDLKYVSKLRFDFYLPDFNACIEYDGKQHFEPVEKFGGEKEFLLTRERDNQKNEYCKQKGIHLLRIPYKIKNLEEQLTLFLKQVM